MNYTPYDYMSGLKGTHRVALLVTESVDARLLSKFLREQFRRSFPGTELNIAWVRLKDGLLFCFSASYLAIDVAKTLISEKFKVEELYQGMRQAALLKVVNKLIAEKVAPFGTRTYGGSRVNERRSYC